ncbi:Taf10 protein [Starmerella bacillaris]|uniref:Taf10 protein n=1 Tax=Starmerella bacillaris TaxID=1247836 RepID=A0AAV5REJ2_STABA|nr:Taf10 protein [Starmerella bacillaris]
MSDSESHDTSSKSNNDTIIESPTVTNISQIEEESENKDSSNENPATESPSQAEEVEADFMEEDAAEIVEEEAKQNETAEDKVNDQLEDPEHDVDVEMEDEMAEDINEEEGAKSDENPEGEQKQKQNPDAQTATNDVESKTSDIDPVYDQTLLRPIFEQREKSLKELLNSMDEFSPIIPDAVTDYFLSRSGFKTTDHRIKRLMALATQKFIGDIASDAYQFSRIRAQTANSGSGTSRSRVGPGSNTGRVVLTMESLMGVLGDYGVDAERPDYYR